MEADEKKRSKQKHRISRHFGLLSFARKEHDSCVLWRSHENFFHFLAKMVRQAEANWSEVGTERLVSHVLAQLNRSRLYGRAKTLGGASD